MMNKWSQFDLSLPRRDYYSKENPTNCPECGSDLIEESCTILVCAKSDSDEGEFMTNSSGSHFCNECPVVIFDTDQIEKAALLGIRGNKNLRYAVAGIIDMDAIPENKSHLEIGTDENPMPLVNFLPKLNKQKVKADKAPGRNDLCSCESGKKYKKCCGR